MRAPAAIGLRAHSGWAAAVALASPPHPPAVITRRRLTMVDPKAASAKQPYHAAVGLEIGEAGQIVAHSAARAAALATIALRGMIDDLSALGHEVTGCGLLLAAGRPLPALEGILASHALIHTAEGEHFRQALRAASRNCGLPLLAVKERELFTRASADLEMPVRQIEQHAAAMGKAIGPPWRQDEKFAAVAAWLALRTR